MVTEARGIWQNGTNEDYKTVITNLYSDKVKLLKEQKTLYLLLADKEEQILRMSDIYKTRWNIVCDHLRNIEQLCNGEDFSNLKVITSELLNATSLLTNMDSSVSSYFTATDTAESTVSTSSESIVAKCNTDTLTKFSGFQSLNSLANDDKPSENDYNHLGIVDQTTRSYSDSVQDNNDFSTKRSGLETDTSESLFRAPESYVRRSKKLTKKAPNKSDKSTIKIEPKLDPLKPISEFTYPEILNWLLTVARLPKILIEDIKIKNKINATSLDQVTEHKFEKLFGTSDKLIKKKVLCALEDYKSNETYKDQDDLSSKDHLWVANVWLKKHVGLSHLSVAFLSRCIDGKSLKSIAKQSHSRMKELISLAATNYESSSGISATPLSSVNRAIYEPSKSDLRSLRFGLELLIKFNFNLQELETRRAACEDLNKDVLVWTNDRFAKWLQNQNLKNYIRGIEYSGIHGAMMVLDAQFSVSTMFKLIQIPPEVAKKNNLDEKISILLKPSRFNEGVKSRRSTSIFRRRSLSQPRYTKSFSGNNRTANATPEISDSASNNDSATLNIAVRHVEKSRTIDLSHSPSRNNNFIRNYRKPDHLTLKVNVTDVDTDIDTPNNKANRHFIKSPPLKLSSPFQIPRKIIPNNTSGSENDEDFEI